MRLRAETQFSDGSKEPLSPHQKSVQWGDHFTGSRNSSASPPSVVGSPSGYAVVGPASPLSKGSKDVLGPYSSDLNLHYGEEKAQNWPIAEITTQPTESATTIVRRQHRERSQQRILPKSRSSNLEAFERNCPPRPPKYPVPAPRRHAGTEDPLTRPTSRKPQRRRQLGPPSCYQIARSRSLPRVVGELNAGSAGRGTIGQFSKNNHQMTPRRSASSIELSKLYQTRDCLGRVVYEL